VLLSSARAQRKGVAAAGGAHQTGGWTM